MVLNMRSITELYNIGRGPSSSHTMGPERAALRFMSLYPQADGYRVTLYGSLAMTGRGHGTDRILGETLPNAEIVFDTETTGLPHPNTMDFAALKDGRVIGKKRILSVGGGAIKAEGETETGGDVYPHKSFSEIMSWCRERDCRVYDYVREFEGDGAFRHLEEVWAAMQDAVREGLSQQGELPGGLHISRKAKYLYELRCHNESSELREDRMISAYAYAVSEQNACGGRIVTAPTCGSCGVLPAMLYYMKYSKGFSDGEIICALATAGVVGNVIKHNASISGAECGCQAEIGSACSMAAAGLAELYGMEIEKIEYAAEVAMEHHLGLTCDPVRGLVQIPCIERNAVAAMRAVNAVSIAHFLSDTRTISFDAVVSTMYETGRDLALGYRETSTGGLARLYE